MKGQSVKACEPFSKANLMAGESQYFTHAKLKVPIWVKIFQNCLHQELVFQITLYNFNTDDTKWHNAMTAEFAITVIQLQAIHFQLLLSNSHLPNTMTEKLSGVKIKLIKYWLQHFSVHWYGSHVPMRNEGITLSPTRVNMNPSNCEKSVHTAIY